MNKEQYIKFRKANAIVNISYYYWMENGGKRMDIQSFNSLFTQYVAMANPNLDLVIKELDNKFELIILEDIKTNKILDIW